ncbi:MAG: class I SAM-dependent methyltransferase [Pseudohongiellaceae bacterium]
MKSFQDHFSGHAQVYSDARPSYPDELFRFLASSVSCNRQAWDCATGNGQSAIGLAGYFDHVVATDGSSEQIAQAPSRPNIDYRVAVAEEHILPPASVDLVTVAQALHWLDLERFFPVVDAALKPEGVLAIWSYGIHTIDPAVDTVINRLYRETLDGYWTPERAMVEEGYRHIEFPFSPVENPGFSMSLQWSRPQVEEYLRSWSAVQKYLKVNRVDPVTELSCPLAAAWGKSEFKTITWPLTLVLRQKPGL